MKSARELTEELLRHYPFVYCPTLAASTKNTNPHRGDVVLFYRNGTFTHTGLVASVTSDTYHTIEGNTSGASGVIANGGGVCKKSYGKYSVPGTRFFTPDYELLVKEGIYKDIASAISGVLSAANAEVGYLEKRSNSNLHDKTANAGSANYTKYWEDIYPQFQGQPWCAVFVTWCIQNAIQNGIDKSREYEKVKNSEKPKHPWIKRGYKYCLLMQNDTKSGKKWIYSNHGTKSTFYRARKYNVRKTNCAKFINWILRAEKITKSGMYFYGHMGQIKWANDKTKQAIEAKCDIMNICGKYTLKQMYDRKLIIPGDIIMYQDIQHTNMLGYNGWFYDAGHAYAIGSGEGAVFKAWRGKKMVHANQRVSHVIRLRGDYRK